MKANSNRIVDFIPASASFYAGFGPLNYEPFSHQSEQGVLLLVAVISLALHLAVLTQIGRPLFRTHSSSSLIEVDLSGSYEVVPARTTLVSRPLRKGNPEASPEKSVASPAKPSAVPNPSAEGSSSAAAAPNASERTGNLTGENDGAEYALVSLTSLPKLKNGNALQASIRRLYPDAERRAGHEGKVTLALHVDIAGHVTKAEIVQSAGPAFDAAALELAPLLEFEPARVGTKTVPVKIRQSIAFAMKAWQR